MHRPIKHSVKTTAATTTIMTHKLFSLRMMWLVLVMLVQATTAASTTTSTTSSLSRHAATNMGGGLVANIKGASSSTSSMLSMFPSWAVKKNKREGGFASRAAASQSSIDASNTNRRRRQASSLKDTVRGGASAIKTMTARQMEAFNLVSGGAAGTFAACITSPLEVIKTQLQSSNTGAQGILGGGRGHPVTVAKRIFNADGVPGFFRGLPPTLVGIIPSRSAYFYCYQRSRKALAEWGNMPEGSPPNAIVSGLVAGIVGNTLTNPIWMVRTRMQILADATAGQRAYKGYRDAVNTIWKEEGLGGFYRGMPASYWGCIEGSVQFVIYEQLKKRLLRRHNAWRAEQGLSSNETDLPNYQYFWSAAAAKMFASIGTYPHEVARTRMREQARSGVFKYKGMWQTLSVIGREEGRMGLYSGMGVHLLKVVPNSALMFLTYEVVRSWLGEFTIVDAADGKVVGTK